MPPKKTDETTTKWSCKRGKSTGRLPGQPEGFQCPAGYAATPEVRTRRRTAESGAKSGPGCGFDRKKLDDSITASKRKVKGSIKPLVDAGFTEDEAAVAMRALNVKGIGFMRRYIADPYNVPDDDAYDTILWKIVSGCVSKVLNKK